LKGRLHLAYLVDTSVLVRLANDTDPQHDVADRAVVQLHLRGETLHLTPQVFVEFYNVATRPANVNGLGYSIPAVEQKVSIYESVFPLLPETPAIHPAWRSLVSAAAVIGKQVHDARLAAICQVHAVSHLLTFNTRHFTRFTPHIPTLTVVDPAAV
jgi:predicted nucleic acid-binding protein